MYSAYACVQLVNMKVINLKRTFVINTIVQYTERGRVGKTKRGNELVLLDICWLRWSLEESFHSDSEFHIDVYSL